MSLVSYVTHAVMLVSLNGVPVQEIPFTSYNQCVSQKPAVSQQYKYPQRRHLKITCIKQ